MIIKRLLAVVLFLFFVWYIMASQFQLDPLIIIMLAGLFTAITGMMKDAPYEGFELLKFWRSPLLAVLSGLILLLIPVNIPSPIFLISVLGFERIFSEFYKKIARGKVPGKFASQNYSELWQNRRVKTILPLYTLNLLALGGLFLLSIG